MPPHRVPNHRKSLKMAPDTLDTLAATHARAFTRLRAWSEEEIARLLDGPLVFLCPLEHGFALGRVVADEAELLTLAVDPAHQRRGIGRACLAAFEAKAVSRGATTAYLEVDSANTAALTLYHRSGYKTQAHRKDYYALSNGQRADAIVMAKPLSR